MNDLIENVILRECIMQSSFDLVVLAIMLHIISPPVYYSIVDKPKYKEQRDQHHKREHYHKKRPPPPKPTFLSKAKRLPTFITFIPDRCVIRRKE